VTLVTAGEVRSQIRSSTSDGDPLDRIEHELIDPAPLDDDQKSGLWLYAWSSLELGRDRRWTPPHDVLVGRG
jgi:hypothetical protein